MSELRAKSLHQLRGMAQAFGVDDIFEKDAAHLIQEIELKQKAMTPEPAPVVVRRPYDARLMTKPPSRTSSPTDITDALSDHIRLGLNLKLDEENWYMTCGKRNDSGTIRMPLRQIIQCADKVMLP